MAGAVVRSVDEASLSGGGSLPAGRPEPGISAWNRRGPPGVLPSADGGRRAMKVPIKVGLVLAAVALLAACGSVAAPVASGPRVHPGRPQLVATGGPPAGRPARAGTPAR